MNYNTKLYNKMSTELKNFISELKDQSPDLIIESAYELVMKEDLLSIFEYTDYTEDEAKALFELSYPLDAIYQAWLKNDLTYMDLLEETIRIELEKIIKP